MLAVHRSTSPASSAQLIASQSDSPPILLALAWVYGSIQIPAVSIRLDDVRYPAMICLGKERSATKREYELVGQEDPDRTADA